MASDYARIVDQIIVETAEKFPNVGNKVLWKLIIRFIIRRYYDIAFEHYGDRS